MRGWRGRCLQLLVAALAVPALASAPVPRSPFILFAVERSEAWTVLDPVARIDGAGRIGLLYGPEKPDSDARARAFIAQWLTPGKTYGVLFGGAPAGTATIRERPGDPGISLQAPSTLRVTAPLRDKTMGLATSQTDFPLGKPLQRRLLTSPERAALVLAAQGAFRKAGMSQASAQKAVVMTGAALNLDGTGRCEVVARLQANDPKAKKLRRCDLFVIAEPSGAAGFTLRLTIPHKNNGTVEDVDYVEQNLVDALDLNGDGIAEVVTRSLYYESHDYTIYQKRAGGTWRAVYRGAGGGV